MNGERRRESVSQLGRCYHGLACFYIPHFPGVGEQNGFLFQQGIRYETSTERETKGHDDKSTPDDHGDRGIRQPNLIP